LKYIYCFLTFFAFYIPNVFADNLIADNGEKESIYIFTYLSPGSHAMVNAANAWEFMVERRGLHKDAKLYRLPYIDETVESTEYAAKAYFMLRQLISNKAVDHFSLEPKLYSLFKTVVVDDIVLNNFFIDNVDGLSLAEAERLNRASMIYIRHTLDIQESFRCEKLPCARVSSGGKTYIVTLDPQKEDPLTEFWEHVSIILL